MSAVAIQVDNANMNIALGKFRASLQQKGELMQQIGVYMLGSIRRTFREQGSPANSAAGEVRSAGGEFASQRGYHARAFRGSELPRCGRD